MFLMLHVFGKLHMEIETEIHVYYQSSIDSYLLSFQSLDPSGIQVTLKNDRLISIDLHCRQVYIRNKYLVIV